ncbi:MAG: stage II sporulation protein P, partial [Bacillota bacterium]
MRKLFYMTALVLFLSFLGPIFSDDLIGFHSVSAVDFELNLPDLGLWEQERTDGGYYTIVDDKNNILDKTCRNVFVGDEFIAGNNRHYRVNKVIEDLAYASLLAEDALFNIRNETNTDVVPVLKGKINNLIALYHTHTGESYVPSDGSESLPGKGGIYKVGEKIKEKLQEKNIIVKYDKTPHDPHDADAYRRSRRTAVELMKNNPAAIIDVHRDGVPDPDFYFTNISGMDVTKIRFVVGRQNQNMQSNLEFAKHLKSQLDEFYPGLVHGIFMAKGNYNQDLSPRSL